MKGNAVINKRNEPGRLIPSLTIDGNRLVKTKKFENYKYLGDPINAIHIFNNFYVDELIIIDITRNSIELDSKLMMASQIANQALMPISYGGGINSESIVVDLFKMGFDKIILKSFLVNTKIVKKMVSIYGSQAFSACIEVQVSKDQYLINGTLMSLNQVIELVNGYIKLGVGEVFLNYRDLDGTRLGLPNDNLISNLIESFKIPVVVCGGTSTKKEAEDYVNTNSLVSVAASSIFTLYGKNDAVILNY
jgi:cyclase